MSLSVYSKASILKAVKYGDRLYFCKLQSRLTDEFRYEVLAHSLWCDRVVLCGGNPGMSYSSQFEGNPRGVYFWIDGKSWSVKDVVAFNDNT